jgi:hypothetical protein
MQRLLILLVALCCHLAGNAQFKSVSPGEKPYMPGEHLKYVVKIGPVTGGTASVVIRHASYNNKLVYHARAEGKTVGLAEKLYRVKDIFESYFDLQTTLPYKSIRDVKEGNYKKHEEAIFNRDSCTAYSLRKDTLIIVPPDILDMVSLLYYVRGLDLRKLKPGDVLPTMTFFDDELFPFDIRYKGKEEIKTKYGKIRCLRFDPVVEPGRIFKSEDDMTIWFSDDRNMIPVKVRFDLIIVPLRMELDEYTNLKYPLEILDK